ncbi:MAG TPA: hypothetical protein VKY26_11500 [Actinomycetota bacterium]|nr:hypothetical protein [Actinomycetota bacterium]
MDLATVDRSRPPMGRLKGGRRSERDDVTVKIDRQVADKAKLVALRRRITMAELLTEILRAPIDRAYRQEVGKLTQEEGG